MKKHITYEYEIEPFDFFLDLKEGVQNSLYFEKEEVKVGDELELFAINESGDEVYIYRKIKEIIKEDAIEVLANWEIEMVNPVLVVFEDKYLKEKQ